MSNYFRLCIIVKKVAHTRLPEQRVLELIPVLGSQPAGDVSHKPACRLPLLSARPAVTLLGEQSHDRCEQFALDCYPTVSRL